MPSRVTLRGYAARAGYRGLGLATFAATCFLYGSGLLAGYHPTFFTAYGLRTEVFGWCFIGLGCFALTGVLLREDRWHYAACTLCLSAWVLLLATHWTQPYGWAAAVSWMSVCGALVIAAAWPEPARNRNPPEPDPAEEPP